MKYTSNRELPGTKQAGGNEELIFYKGHFYDWFKGRWRYLY